MSTTSSFELFFLINNSLENFDVIHEIDSKIWNFFLSMWSKKLIKSFIAQKVKFVYGAMVFWDSMKYDHLVYYSAFFMFNIFVFTCNPSRRALNVINFLPNALCWNIFGSTLQKLITPSSVKIATINLSCGTNQNTDLLQILPIFDILWNIVTKNVYSTYFLQIYKPQNSDSDMV